MSVRGGGRNTLSMGQPTGRRLRGEGRGRRQRGRRGSDDMRPYRQWKRRKRGKREGETRGRERVPRHDRLGGRLPRHEAARFSISTTRKGKKEEEKQVDTEYGFKGLDLCCSAVFSLEASQSVQTRCAEGDRPHLYLVCSTNLLSDHQGIFGFFRICRDF